MVTTLTPLKLLDVLALTEPLPQYSLLPGQVGTIIETLAANIYEVEFSDDNGQTYVMLPLKAAQLIRLLYSPSDTLNHLPKPMNTHIHQHGLGDNIAGDKVLGDKNQTQINNNPDLAQAARDIKALLDELSEEYNPNSDKGQTKIKESAWAQIKQNPQIKQRTLKALKAVGEETLEQAIDHPVAKVAIKGIQAFLEG
jgi:hypothetical protein